MTTEQLQGIIDGQADAAIKAARADKSQTAEQVRTLEAGKAANKIEELVAQEEAFVVARLADGRFVAVWENWHVAGTADEVQASLNHAEKVIVGNKLK